MPNAISVKCAHLLKGDVLIPTNREVVRVSRGISTPSGKVDVDLRRAEPEGNDDNPAYRSTFRRDTVVTVVRN